MVFKIAWRNIWRSKRRSIIVITSVVIGVIAIIISDGLSNGMLNQMLFNQVNTGVSHIQIHNKGFRDNINVKNFIPDYQSALNVINGNPMVKNYSKRVVTFGLLSSAINSAGVLINGIVPSEEKNITIISSSVKTGKYLSTNSNEILIGREIAEKLSVGLGDKVVVMANTPDGSIGSEAFRICGIFETYSSDFDKTNIYIPIETAQKILDIGDNIHEIAVITKNYNEVSKTGEDIISRLNGNYEVLTYKDLLPMLIIQMDLYNETMYIFNLIFGIALFFGIVNVMLMAVFERINEFGVLKSIGMKNSGLFYMIVSESVMIGIIGCITGIILGFILQEILSGTGIDFSMFSESLKSFGVGAVIYPETTITNIISIILMIPFISVLGAVYPAVKAMRLEPVSAVRYV